MKNSSSKGFAPLPGGRLYYEESGEGHPVVLIHGQPVDSAAWDDQWEEFAQRYRVIRYDLRNHGRSSDSEEGAAHTEDLANLLSFLKAPAVYLVGQGMGCATAIDFTLEHPNMIGALVLASPALTGHVPSPEAAESVAAVAAPYASRFFAAAEAGDLQQLIDLAIEITEADPATSASPLNSLPRKRIRAMIERNSNCILLDPADPSHVEPQATHRLGDIRCPVLNLIGDHDSGYRKEIVEEICNGVNKGSCVVITEAGEYANIDQPEEFNTRVLNFLTSVDQTRVE